MKRCSRRRLLPYVRRRQPIAPKARDETRLAHTRVPRHCTPCSPAHSTLFDAYYLIVDIQACADMSFHHAPVSKGTQLAFPALGRPSEHKSHWAMSLLSQYRSYDQLCCIFHHSQHIRCEALSPSSGAAVRLLRCWFFVLTYTLVLCVHQIGRPNVDQLVPHISRHHQVCRSRISAHIVPWAKGIFARSERLMRTWVLSS